MDHFWAAAPVRHICQQFDRYSMIARSAIHNFKKLLFTRSPCRKNISFPFARNIITWEVGQSRDSVEWFRRSRAQHRKQVSKLCLWIPSIRVSATQRAMISVKQKKKNCTHIFLLNCYVGLFFIIKIRFVGPFGEQDDEQVFVQKVVPETDQLFVRLASNGKRVCVIQSVDGSIITSFCVHECEGSSRMGSRPRRFIFTGHSNGTIQMWDLTTALDPSFDSAQGNTTFFNKKTVLYWKIKTVFQLKEKKKIQKNSFSSNRSNNFNVFLDLESVSEINFCKKLLETLRNFIFQCFCTNFWF